MHCQRILSKACNYRGQAFFVLGGNKEPLNCERYDVEANTWSPVDVKKLNTIKNWKCFGYSSYTVEVEHDEKTEVFNDDECADKNYIFGTDDEPFIISINKLTFKSEALGCPLKLKLKNYQGACKIGPSKIFIGGGINKELKIIFQSSYIIDMKDMSVTQCQDMQNLRYTFSTVFKAVSFFYNSAVCLRDRGQTVRS